MPDPIRRMTLDEFACKLESCRLSRRITSVHLHHTWRPRRRDFTGRDTIEAMRRYHMTVNGWSDIAQHLTIDPEGGLWTGRDWNRPPASSTGRNGSATEGPFMIEMIGDFDAGEDPFDGPQREAAIEVAARLLRRFGLDEDALFFHRELGSPKSCPGTGIDKGDLVAAVRAAREALV